MKISSLLTRYSKFILKLDDVDFIDELFYRPLTRFLFKNYRDEIWKTFMNVYTQESGLLLSLSELFYNFSKNPEFREKFLELLKMNNNDFTLRFLLQTILEKHDKASFFTFASISYLLMDQNYSFPPYADRLNFINLLICMKINKFIKGWLF